LSAVVGERDRLLRGTVPRNIDPSAGKTLRLDVDPPAFHQSSAGIPTIPSVKFTATPVGFVGQVLWSITSGGKLTGTTPNERTLLFADMTVDTVKVTATIVYDGQAYIAVKTLYKVTDGKPGKDGKDADPSDLSPEALAKALEGKITESQLYHDLAARIDLVDGPASNPTTVQGQIKKETDARIAALTKEADDRKTYVQQYTYSEQEIDQSLSIWAATITSQYKTYADTVSGAAVSQSSADVRSYAYSKTDADRALTAMANTLRSEFATNNGVTTAYLNQYYYTQAQTNSAISSATQTLSTTVGQHTTSLQTQAQSINGLSAQYTVKIDNNGYVTGYGLASSIVNGAPTSAFIVNAGAFSVVAPGVAPAPMFTVGQVGGRTKMVLRGDMYADGDIKASNLTIGNFDQVCPDSNMMDAKFWGVDDGLFIDYFNNTIWKSRRVLSVGTGTPYFDRFTPLFPVERNALYKFDFQVFCSGDYQGELTVVAHLPAQEWFYMGAPQQGYQNSTSGLPVSFDANTRGGVYSYSGIRRINNNDAGGQTQFRIICHVAAGYIQVGGFKVTRVMDRSLVGDGEILARHITVDSMQALSNIVVARPGGWGQGVDINSRGLFMYDQFNNRTVVLGDDSL
jgi:hypothetical protein